MNDKDKALFSDADLISSYSRAQAIEDGVLVDVSETAREAGFKFPVAMTREAWEDCVAWDEESTKRTGFPQDESGRLWDVVTMLRYGIKRHQPPAGEPLDTVIFELIRVPRVISSHSFKLERDGKTKLKAVIGPGDTPEPVITISLPTES